MGMKPDDAIDIEEFIKAQYESMSEAQFQKIVEGYAKVMGWLYYHTYDSRRSVAGYPDLVMLRGERQVVAELKRQKGKKPSEKQQNWLDRYKAVGAEVYVWRPAHIPEIEEILK